MKHNMLVSIFNFMAGFIQEYVNHIAEAVILCLDY